MTELSKDEFISELIERFEADGGSDAPTGDQMPVLVRLQMRYRAGEKLGARDADVLKLCTQLFRNEIESIDCDSQLLALAQKLQIPVLIAALENSGFFGRDGHPARTLLSTVASMLLDSTGKSADELGLLKANLQAVVAKVGERLPCADATFNDAQQLIAGEGPAVELSRPPPDAATGRQILARELQARIGAAALPPIVRELIEQGWSRALYTILLKEGEDTEDWRDGLRLIDDIVQSLGSDLDVQQRNRVMEHLPEWLEELRRGLTRAGNLTPRLSKVLEATQTLIMARIQAAAVDSTSTTENDEDARLLESIISGSWIIIGDDPRTQRWRISAIPRRAGCFVLSAANSREVRRVPADELLANIRAGRWQHEAERDAMINTIDSLRQHARQLRAAQQ